MDVPISDISKRLAERTQSERLELHVPELDATLYFEVLSPGDRDRYLGPGKDDADRAVRLLIAKAQTEDGQKVFSIADRPYLMNYLPWAVLDRIFVAVFEFVPGDLDPKD